MGLFCLVFLAGIMLPAIDGVMNYMFSRVITQEQMIG
jgi:hypothetical protein